MDKSTEDKNMIGKQQPVPTNSVSNPMPKKPKNWDAIVKELDNEDESENSAEDLFKKIYSEGSDEVRKAMVKSFTESGGTVLSTNWDQVRQGQTEVKPPEGCEFKKWN